MLLELPKFLLANATRFSKEALEHHSDVCQVKTILDLTQ